MQATEYIPFSEVEFDVPYVCWFHFDGTEIEATLKRDEHGLPKWYPKIPDARCGGPYGGGVLKAIRKAE